MRIGTFLEYKILFGAGDMFFPSAILTSVGVNESLFPRPLKGRPKEVFFLNQLCTVLSNF